MAAQAAGSAAARLRPHAPAGGAAQRPQAVSMLNTAARLHSCSQVDVLSGSCACRLKYTISNAG